MLLRPRKKKNKTKIRIYIDGVFDLFHHGHANAIKQAKEAFDECQVIVGINTDEDTEFYKGKPVLRGEERKLQISACRFIDKIIYPAPWYPSLDFIEKHNIDFVAHDEIAYGTEELDDIYFEAKLAGKFLRTFRTPEISTSELIQRIIREREKHIMNLSQRGFTLDEMNVSRTYYAMILVNHLAKVFLDKLVCCFWCKKCKRRGVDKRFKKSYQQKGNIYTCK